MLVALITFAMQATTLDVPVTYRCVATSTATVVEQLAKATHTKLESTSMGDWPIIVSVKDVKLSDLMTRIAEVTDSEWTTSGDRHILLRDSARVKKAKEAELKDRSERLGTWMATNLPPHAPRAWSDEEIQSAFKDAVKRHEQFDREQGKNVQFTEFEFRSRTPGEILLKEFIRQIPLKEFALIPANARLCYSDQPAGNVQPLPFSLQSAMNAYLQTRARFAQLAPEIAAGQGKYVTQFELMKKPFDLAGRIIFTIARPNASSAIKVQMTLVDAKGELADLAGVSIELAPLPPTQVPADLEGKVELSRLNAELIDQFAKSLYAYPRKQYYRGENISFRAPDVPPIPPALYQELHHPEVHEPASYFASDWLLQLSEKRGEQLVAYVPDHDISPVAGLMKTSLLHKDLWKGQDSLALTFAEKDSWLTIRPRLFGRADRYRVNRKAFATLMHTFEHGLPTIDQVIAYVNTMPETYYKNNLDVRLLRYLHPFVYDCFDSMPGMAKVKLLASLTPQQRLGGQLNLSPTQLGWVQQFDPQSERSYENIGFETGLGTSRGIVEARDFEPAVNPPFAPNGIFLNHTVQPGVAVVMADGSLFPLSAIGLGFHFGLRPENAGDILAFNQSVKVIPSDVEVFEFRIDPRYAPGGTTLTGYRVAHGSPGDVAQLPTATLELIEKGRAMSKDLRIGTFYGPSTVPPR